MCWVQILKFHFSLKGRLAEGRASEGKHVTICLILCALYERFRAFIRHSRTFVFIDASYFRVVVSREAVHIFAIKTIS